jgi:hypothetical protein
MRYDGCEAFYEKLFKGVQKIGEASAVQEGVHVQIVRDWELYVREEHPEQDDSCNCLPATACSIHDRDAVQVEAACFCKILDYSKSKLPTKFLKPFE